MLKLNVILKFFQVELKKHFLIALAFYSQMNFIKMRLCPQQSSIGEHCMKTTKQSILLQLKHTHTGKNRLNSEFISNYLPQLFSQGTLIRKKNSFLYER